MNKFIKKIYFKTPGWMKSILVTIYGIKVYRERYGRHSKYYDDLLNRSQLFDQEEMRKLQERMFVEIARSAIKEVPFYNSWACENNIKEDDITSISSISLFPIIEKETVRKNPEQFVSKKYRLNRLIKLSTSGSTGKPTTIYVDKESRTFHYAFFSRLRRWYGVNKNDRRITFLGRVVVESGRSSPPFWVYDATQKNLIMSAFHMSTENLYHYYRKLRDFRPKEIFGYASSIYQLSKYIVEKELPQVSVKLIMTTAETLMPYQREMIRRAFRANLVNQYGCTEMAFFGNENSDSRMLMHPEHAFIEVLDDLGNIVEEGNGDIIATSLINRAMPIIRYRVGDRISKSVLIDPQFPGFSILDNIEGRTDDAIYTKDGRVISRITTIFKSDKCITFGKVVQQRDGAINIYVVPSDGYGNFHHESIRIEALEIIGTSVPINVIEVEMIEREENGKFRPVKSLYNPNYFQ